MVMGLADKILKRIQTSEYWTTKTRKKGKTIQGLTCPACGIEGAAWAYSDSPMAIICNRLNNCGTKTNTVELFNLRLNIEKEFKPTKTEPHRPARAYLTSRGLKESLNGLSYEYWKNVRHTSSGAVMFPVQVPGTTKPIFNGRLMAPSKETGKTHNSGTTTGAFWQHPGIEYSESEPTYIVEGIIDALSIIELGLQAIAVLASGQDPAAVDLSRFKNIALAFDNDAAGQRALKKWLCHYPAATVVMPDKGGDWNDLLNSAPLDQAKANFRNSLLRFTTNAKLALAESAKAYSEIYREYHQQPPGLFEFNGELWFSYLKQ